MIIKTVAVMDLGSYGGAFAASLLKLGYQVTGFDPMGKKISDLVPLGLKPAGSPREAAETAELIILSLPTWDKVREAVEGQQGILATGRHGQVVIDTSPAAPWETKAMADRLASKGIDWMDASTSGTSAQARSGDIVFMAAGKESAFQKVKPVLDGIGKKTIYAGKNGDAAMLKLVVNITVHLNQAAAIEGFVMALKAGLNPDVVYEAMASGTAASTIIETRGRDMLQGNFEEKKGELTTKYYDLALEGGKRLGVMLPLTALFREFVHQALHNGWGECDNMVVMRVYEQMAGMRR
jgi:3-hydroxyisobutyrate dehydrogenase-like beta-hydroxyacid dehydrogenase